MKVTHPSILNLSRTLKLRPSLRVELGWCTGELLNELAEVDGLHLVDLWLLGLLVYFGGRRLVNRVKTTMILAVLLAHSFRTSIII